MPNIDERDGNSWTNIEIIDSKVVLLFNLKINV